MQQHPIRFYLAILPLYVMAAFLLFMGPGVFAKTRSAAEPPAKTESPKLAKPAAPRAGVREPRQLCTPLPPAVAETPLTFEELPVSKEDRPEKPFAKGLDGKGVPAQVKDRLGRSIWWICAFKKEDADHLGHRRRFARAHLDDRFDLYMVLENSVGTGPDQMLLVLWDKQHRKASTQTRLIHCSRAWIREGDLPRLSRADYDLDGLPELVLYMQDFNGTVHDSVDKHYLSINTDLTLRRSLTVVTDKSDERPWNPEHKIERSLHSIDKNTLVISTWRTSLQEGAPRIEIGRLELRRSEAHTPFQVARILEWDNEDGDEVENCFVRLQPRILEEVESH